MLCSLKVLFVPLFLLKKPFLRFFVTGSEKNVTDQRINAKQIEFQVKPAIIVIHN